MPGLERLLENNCNHLVLVEIRHEVSSARIGLSCLSDPERGDCSDLVERLVKGKINERPIVAISA
jgi:hypothetical protein